MQKIIKTFWLGLVFWLGFFVIWWIGYFLLRARQTTNPWIADDWQGLYATNGNTLTAGKWNSLVQRSTRVDVANTDTVAFDTSCERRAKILWWAGACALSHIWYLSMVTWNGAQLIVGWSSGVRYIDNTAKTKIYLNGTTYCNISLLQKRCY